MKFSFATPLISLLLATVPALSQSIAIGFPSDGASVNAGSNITVEVDRPDTLSGSIEVAIVIALNSCHNTTCIPPEDILGSILYNGPYKPEFQASTLTKPPYQNFTVTVPSGIGAGPAQLAVYHVALIGAGPEPFTEIRNITLKVLQ